MAAFTLNRVPSQSVLVLVGADGRTGRGQISPVREVSYMKFSRSLTLSPYNPQPSSPQANGTVLRPRKQRHVRSGMTAETETMAVE